MTGRDGLCGPHRGMETSSGAKALKLRPTRKSRKPFRAGEELGGPR